MNWDRVEGKWKQRRGKTVHLWGKLMNGELAAIAGKHELLVGVLQEKYGIAKEEAKEQIKDLKRIIDQLKKSNAKLVKSQQAAAGRARRSNGQSKKFEETKRSMSKRSPLQAGRGFVSDRNDKSHNRSSVSNERFL